MCSTDEQLKLNLKIKLPTAFFRWKLKSTHQSNLVPARALSQAKLAVGISNGYILYSGGHPVGSPDPVTPKTLLAMHPELQINLHQKSSVTATGLSSAWFKKYHQFNSANSCSDVALVATTG